MATEREQKLVDIAYQLAMVSARNMQDKSSQEIADWVTANLKACGFPTAPMGMSWGVLQDDRI